MNSEQLLDLVAALAERFPITARLLCILVAAILILSFLLALVMIAEWAGTPVVSIIIGGLAVFGVALAIDFLDGGG